MFRFLLLISYLLLAESQLGLAQISSDQLEQNAVEIKSRKESTDALYDRIKDQKAILIGEVHGTKEQPEFYLGIVHTLQNHGKKVLAAIELPRDGVNTNEKLDLDKLKHSEAFNSHTLDGRQCVAWAEMLIDLQSSGAKVLCFDLGRDQKGDNRRHRDSLMFANINDGLKKDTSLVLVVLSGNVSTRMVPYKNAKTLGYYLQNDETSALKGKKILSLLCMYNGGEAYNWVNNGYKQHELESNAGFYGYAAPYDNYLLIYPVLEGYNGALFSSVVTASGPLVEKK
jgi:hypothetical protein